MFVFLSGLGGWVELPPEVYPPSGTEHFSICASSQVPYQLRDIHSNEEQLGSSLPTVYFVTPTYRRREQVAELTRLGQTLLLVPNIHWIVAEDSFHCSKLVSDMLTRFGIPYTHLLGPQPNIMRKGSIRHD